MLKLELMILAALTTIGMATPGSPGLLEGLLQFSALGLCGLMVWQNDKARREGERRFDRQRSELLGTIQGQLKQTEEDRQRLEVLHTRTLDVIRKCTR